ncbi:DUF7882 family protein [Leifsonia shinshuensis]|uniref:DUF7882 family protein n=1 Tax=Leifsonia shinshuensis TaxID=150026 RepID=UPI00404520E4
MDDVLLQALEVVSFTKMRRREPFLLSWRDSTDETSGRRTVVVGPTVELQFTYLSARVLEVRRDLIETLTQAANSNFGIRLDAAARAVQVAPAEIASADIAPGPR